MHKKVTFTLEEELIDSLSDIAEQLGKKKTQVVREALHQYLATASKEQMEAQWLETNQKAIDTYNRRVEEAGVFSDGLRGF